MPDLYRRAKLQERFLGLDKLLAKNFELQAETDTVVVIGNGPSTNQLDLPSLLAGVDVIVMNSFYRHPDAHRLKIVSYCVGEQGVDVPNFNISKVFEVPSERYWFSADFDTRLSPLPVNVHLYLPGNDGVLKQHRKNLDLSGPSPGYETTAQMAIIVALAMGYKRVILLGYDHNFLSSGEYLVHFYDEDLEDKASLSKLYIDGGDYHALIQNCDRMWSRYKKINTFARSRNVEIINCGKNSYLDVFRCNPLEDSTAHINKHLENFH